MSSGEIILGIVASLFVNETCDLSPWAAKKLVQWSARVRYTDPKRAETRAAELVSLIEERPGKLLKLLTSIGFICAAILIRMLRLSKQKVQSAVQATQKLTVPTKAITNNRRGMTFTSFEVTEAWIETIGGAEVSKEGAREIRKAIRNGYIKISHKRDNGFTEARIDYDRKNISIAQLTDWLDRVVNLEELDTKPVDNP